MNNKYRIATVVLLCMLSMTACTAFNQSPDQTSVQTDIISDNSENQPLRLNLNRKFVKHRPVNRRAAHRIHRKHRVA